MASSSACWDVGQGKGMGAPGELSAARHQMWSLTRPYKMLAVPRELSLHGSSLLWENNSLASKE